MAQRKEKAHARIIWYTTIQYTMTEDKTTRHKTKSHRITIGKVRWGTAGQKAIKQRNLAQDKKKKNKTNLDSIEINEMAERNIKRLRAE